MKPLLPSLKEKKRYIVFEAVSESKVSEKGLEKGVNESVLKFLGELGIAKAGFMFVEMKENKGIVRTNVKYQDEIKMALSLIKNINKEKIKLNVIGVSGILNKARKQGGMV